MNPVTINPVVGRPKVAANERELRSLLSELACAPRFAIDLEASGMFAYRARICTLQVAWEVGPATQLAVIDVLAVPIESMGEVLSARGPVKIVHDVAFDARLLAESGIELGNVHDTALSAHMLGRSATGLAAMLESDLGVIITKAMQQHDWRVRPLDDAMLGYLAADVMHLEQLERIVWGQVTAFGIEAEVLEETEYRLASAITAMKCPLHEPAYFRVRGAGQLLERELAVLRAVAELREEEAMRRDVPPFRVAPNEALIAIARSRPTTSREIARMRGISTSTPAARAFACELANAVASTGDTLPDNERLHFAPRRAAAGVSRARREREARLLAWRRAEAKQREVDEQVVLPGHCAKDAADLEAPDLDALRRVRGIGAFRVERYGAAIVNALRGTGDID